MTFEITWILVFECAFVMCHDMWSICNAMNLSLPHQRRREKFLFSFSFTFLPFQSICMMNIDDDPLWRKSRQTFVWILPYWYFSKLYSVAFLLELGTMYLIYTCFSTAQPAAFMKTFQLHLCSLSLFFSFFPFYSPCAWFSIKFKTLIVANLNDTNRTKT